jgi:hypothetical protein
MARAKAAHVDPRRTVAACSDVNTWNKPKRLVEGVRISRFDVCSREASSGADLFDEFGGLCDGERKRRRGLLRGRAHRQHDQ